MTHEHSNLRLPIFYKNKMLKVIVVYTDQVIAEWT